MPPFEKTENLIADLTAVLGLNRFQDIANFKNEKQPFYAAAKEKMQPHIKGEMPNAINKAFPHEGAITFNYRKSIYNSQTAPILAKTITNVKAHVIEKIDFEAAPAVLAYLNQPRFKGRNFKGFMKEYFYPMRVADPNAIIAIKQNVVTEAERNNDPTLELVIYPSENIVAQNADFVIVKTAKPNDKITAAYYFYGRFLQALIHVLQNDTVVIVSTQKNDNGIVPVCPLGGQQTTKEIESKEYYFAAEIKHQIEYYLSDFEYAVPLMNNCEKAANQAEVSALKSTIPITVQRELECGTCEGKGTIYEFDKYGAHLLTEKGEWVSKVCPTCNGKKHVLPIQTNEVIIPHQVDLNGMLVNSGDIGNSIIAYVSPPVENSKYADERMKNFLRELQDALNINAVNLSYATSAESKKEARSEKETQLREIGASIARVYEFLLGSFSLFLSGYGRLNLRADYIAAVQTTLPTQFITVSADELELEFNAQRDKLSLEERDIKQRTIAKNKRPSATDRIDLYYNAAWVATNGNWLYTPIELNELNLTGVLTLEDKVRAVKAANFIYKLVLMDNETNFDSIIAQTNTFIETELQKIARLTMPPLTDTNSTEP